MTSLFAAVLLACSPGSSPTGPGAPSAVTHVEVEPSSVAAPVSDTVHVTARATDDSGAELDRAVSWTIRDPDVARVNEQGVVLARSGGTTYLVADVGGVRDSARVTVEPPASSQPPAIPDGVTIREVGRTDSTVRYRADWGVSDGAEEYPWDAGANNGGWIQRLFTLSSRSTRFEVERPSSDVQSFFCVEGLNPGGTSGDASCTGYTVPAAAASASSPPPASGSDAPPFLVEDFSTYSSTSDMLSDPRGIYVGSGDIREDLIVLDTAEGVPELGTSQSMRYDFEPGVGTISRALDLDGLNELWIEVWVKFSSNFKTDWGGSGNPDYKWIFVNTVTSRFDTKTGTFGTNYRIAGPRNANVDDSGTSSQEWDGEWHRYRVHYKHASATGANDGTVEAWIANEPGGRNLWIGSVGDVDTNIGEDGVGLMQMFHLGRNMNQPPTELVNIWWGKISLWDQDPGW